MGGVIQPVAPGLTGRSTRIRSGIAPQGVRVSICLAARCRCVPVNSDVRQQKYALREIWLPNTGHLPTPVSGPNRSFKRRT